MSGVPLDLPELFGAREVAELLEANGLRLHKHLGQNFVVDPNTIRRVVRLAELSPDDHVIEVGPGFGALTLGLLPEVRKVTAIEISAGVADVLRSVIAERAPAWSDRLEIVVADAAVIDVAALAPDATVLVSNLPYGPATTIVLDVLERAPGIGRMLVMVQREVGERLVADPADAAYGLPSLRVAMNGSARIVGSVSAEVFFPPPRVASVLVEIVRRPDALSVERQAAVMDLARPAFEQRRKMLRSSLRARFDDAGFAAAEVAPTSRPERLDVASWLRLVDVSVRRQGES